MEIIIEENCEYEKILNSLKKNIYNLFQSFKGVHNIDSLKYIVLTSNNPESFSKTVAIYSHKLHTIMNVDNSSKYQTIGQTITGLDDSGVFSQAIVIWSGVVSKILNDILTESEDGLWIEHNYDNLRLLLHEIGHSIDNEILFHSTKELNLQTSFDMSIKIEREKYYKNSAIALWGEYFAESYPYSIIKEMRNKTYDVKSTLLECIDNYYPQNITDRVYRIFYFFAHIAAQNNNKAFDFSIFKSTKAKKYISTFIIFYNELQKIENKYPKIDCKKDFNTISKLLELTVNLEQNT